MARERLLAGAIEVVGKPADPTKNVHRRHIHVGALPPPSGNQSIDFVFGHAHSVRLKILDIERLAAGTTVECMDPAEAVASGPIAQRELLESGQLTSRALVEATLEAMTRTHQRLNACVELYDTSSLEAAEEADRRRAAGETGPFLGIPIAIKDDTDMAGRVTGWGSSAQTRPAEVDAELVAKIRATGAVIVAKTTLPELAICGFTETETFGITRNPHNRAHSCGGSSGGSAAVVGAGAIGIATGTDGAGSIRIPAASCGVVGFKPTQGTMPSSGGWNDLSTQGCLTRTVADTALYLETFGTFEGSLTDAVGTDPAPLRIGIDLHAFPASIPMKVDPRVVAAVASAGDIFTALGHDVKTVKVRYRTAPQSFSVRMLAGIREAAIGVDEPARLEKRTKEVARLGKPLGKNVVDRAGKAGLTFGDGLLDDLDIDILLTPTMSGPAVRIGRWTGRGGLGLLLGMGRFYGFTPAWNHTGQPAVSMPAGFSEEEGLPLAIQLIASRGDDARLIALAAQYERATAERKL